MKPTVKIALIAVLTIVAIIALALIGGENGNFGVLGYLLLGIVFFGAQRIWAYKPTNTEQKEKKLQDVLHSDIVFTVSALMKLYNGDETAANAFLSEQPEYLNEVLSRVSRKKI